MFHARIDGRATATICHPSLEGQIIVFCTPIDENGAATGAPFAAVDPLGSGKGSHVMISTDGPSTAAKLGDNSSPVRNEVIGIIDP